MENILLPSSITFEPSANPNQGALVVTPLYHGYGTTLGNAMRRVLLSSLPGAAITAIKIKGAAHEFSAISGIKEDGVEIVLNVKQVRLKVFSAEPVRLQLKVTGARVVTAGDIEASSDVEIINKDLPLFTITDPKTTVELEFIAGQGRGYVPVEERENKNTELGTIAIDSIYTPVVDVGYTVEFTRVGDITNFEKLMLNIETDGTISPKEAASESVKILMEHFKLIVDAVAS